MTLSDEFWDVQKGLVLVAPSGGLRFTAAGKARYGARFATHGFPLERVRTLERFQVILKEVISLELEARRLEFQQLVDDPRLPERERTLINLVVMDILRSSAVGSNPDAAGRL